MRYVAPVIATRLPLLLQAFLQAFNARQRAAQQQLRALAPADSGSAQASAVTSALDALAAEMAAQEARLAEASYYLPSYDLKSCTAQVLVRNAGWAARAPAPCCFHL